MWPTFAPFMLLRPSDVYIQATSEVMLSMCVSVIRVLKGGILSFFYVKFILHLIFRNSIDLKKKS